MGFFGCSGISGLGSGSSSMGASVSGLVDAPDAMDTIFASEIMLTAIASSRPRGSGALVHPQIIRLPTAP